MSMIKFFMPMIPPTVTAQEHRVGRKTKGGKVLFYDSPELADARDKLTAHLARHKPEKPLEGAVTLAVSWYFPITGKHHNGEWKTSKPDTDNLVKLLKDCMTKVGFWHDDAQVCYELVTKVYSDVPGIGIAVKKPCAEFVKVEFVELESKCYDS